MTMKRTELAKSKMLKAANMMKAIGIPDRFGKGSVMLDRKEQRKLDQAAGLIPFACKLPADLVKALTAEIDKRGGNANEVMTEILTKALAKPSK